MSAAGQPSPPIGGTSSSPGKPKTPLIIVAVLAGVALVTCVCGGGTVAIVAGVWMASARSPATMAATKRGRPIAVVGGPRNDPLPESFDPESASKSADWLYGWWGKIQQARKNDIAFDESRKSFDKDLAALRGKKIRWVVPVASVKRADGGNVRLRGMGISPQAYREDHPWGTSLWVVDVDGSARDDGIGIPLTNDLKTFTTGKILLEAIIANVERGEYPRDPHVTIRVVDVQVGFPK